MFMHEEFHEAILKSCSPIFMKLRGWNKLAIPWLCYWRKVFTQASKFSFGIDECLLGIFSCSWTNIFIRAPSMKVFIVINKKNISRAPSLRIFSCNLTTIFSRAPAITVHSSYWLKIISWMPCMRIFNWNWPERFLRALSDNF